MSTYASITDLQGYTTVSLSTSDGDELQKLLDQAERDVDTLMPKNTPVDSLQGITITGATGGDLTLALPWLGSTYTTDDIPFDATFDELLEELNAATDVLGNVVTGNPWTTPEMPAHGARWAAGPLNSRPVAIQATGELGAQQLAPLVVTSNLTPTSASAEVTVFSGGGTRLDPWQLAPSIRQALRQATCAQAVYRDQMGPEHFIREQYASVSGPDFRTTGKLPMIGPQVFRELDGVEVLQRMARARVSRPATAQRSWLQTGSTPIPDDWRM